MSTCQFELTSGSQSSAISTITGGWWDFDKKARDEFHGTVTSKEITRSRVKFAFEEYRKKLKEQTRFSSSLSDRFENLHYQKIIALGKEVVPVLIHELETRPDHWFYALFCITHENPISDEHAGDLLAMTADWLEWWNRNKVLYDKDIPE